MKRAGGLSLAAAIFLFATVAQAATLSISPETMAVTLAPGTSGAVSAVASLADTPPSSYNYIFTLLPVAGNLPSPWVSTKPTTVSHLAPFGAASVTVRVPAGAAPGRYTLMLIPQTISATTQVVLPSRPLTLTLNVPAAQCAAAPAVALTSFGPIEFKAQGSRTANVDFTGSVSVVVGCTLKRVWYLLVDEYGELGSSRELTAGAGGLLSGSVPIALSRRGDDKDGRQYELSIFAESEAGVAVSSVRTVTIMHDQRK